MVRSMINLDLVSTDKPNQLGLSWVLTMFESDECSKFLAKRVKLLNQFSSIRSIEKKGSDELS